MLFVMNRTNFLSILLIGLWGTAESLDLTVREFHPRAVYRAVAHPGLEFDHSDRGVDTSQMSPAECQNICVAANTEEVIDFINRNIDRYATNALSTEKGPGPTMVYWLFFDDSFAPDTNVLAFECKAQVGSRAFLLAITSDTTATVYIPEKWE